MCGRIALINANQEKIKKRFSVDKIPASLKPRFNISPSQNIAVILNEHPNEIRMVKWGLLPHWSKEENTQYSMINARSETITQKPAFRGPIKKRRCLILADTFYEWKKADGHKEPYRFMKENSDIFSFAGVWDLWEKNNKRIESCSIITKPADSFMKPFHDRMPVILPRELEKEWLKEENLDKIISFLKISAKNELQAYPLSPLINSPLNDSSEVLDHI